MEVGAGECHAALIAALLLGWRYDAFRLEDLWVRPTLDYSAHDPREHLCPPEGLLARHLTRP